MSPPPTTTPPPTPTLLREVVRCGSECGSLYTNTVQQARDSTARRPVCTCKLQCADLPCGYELPFFGEPICKCGRNLISHGGRRQNGRITYGNGAWWPTGSKSPSTTPSPRHDASTNLAGGIRLAATPYAAEPPHPPQFPRDPGLCVYTPSTDASTT